MDRVKYIIEYFNKAGFVISVKQSEQFYKYYELLVSWNEKMNLTGITEFEEVLRKHFLDSIMLIKTEQFGFRSVRQDIVAAPNRTQQFGIQSDQRDINTVNEGFSVKTTQDQVSLIDIGTGAGFPGLPLKIMCPDLEVLLLDSLKKRVDFLNLVIKELQLENITAVHARAEEFVGDGNREKFDFCVSRAVADLRVLSELCIPYVKCGGYFVSYKSGVYENELSSSQNAIHILGGEIETVDKFTLDGGDEERSFIMIRKSESTSDKYPRRSARIMKNPL